MQTFEDAITDLVGSGISVNGDEFHVKSEACSVLFDWLVARAETCKDGLHDLVMENILDYGEVYTKTVLVPLMRGIEPKYSMVDVRNNYIRKLLNENHSDLILNYWYGCGKPGPIEAYKSQREQAA